VNKKIYPKNGVTSATTEDLYLGGDVPKRRPPRPGSKIWVYGVNPEPPPGWRPDSLKR
jgi:hypothetical protein